MPHHEKGRKQEDAILADDDPDEDKLTLLKFSLKEKLETLKMLDSEIVELAPEEELVREIEQADENVYRALTSIDKTLAVAPTPASSAAHATTTPTLVMLSHAAEERSYQRSRYPVSAATSKWTAFWDSYKSAVHSNDELSDVDKFNYLRSLLERTAYEAVAGLTLYRLTMRKQSISWRRGSAINS